MAYGRLGPSESLRRSDPQPTPPPPSSMSSKKRKLLLFSLISLSFLIASGISAVVFVRIRSRGSALSKPVLSRAPSVAISRTCGKTRFQSLCVEALLDFPGAQQATEADLVHISVNVTLQRVGRALYGASSFTNLPMDGTLRVAYDDCMELLGDSVEQLAESLASVAPAQAGGSSADDVLTWLSAALTNQDTCDEGLADVGDGGSSDLKGQIAAQLKDLSELVSNCLAIFAASGGGSDFGGVPIQNRRRLLHSPGEGGAGEMIYPMRKDGFPAWMGRRDRRLLQAPASAIQPNIVVSKDGKNGTYNTIEKAIKAAPEQSSRRTVIYIMAGTYNENLKVGRKKTNLMFIGDGKGKTVITGSRSVTDHYTTFHTATFAATGAGFIARDITFQNTAGPAKRQAVALRIGADHAVVYRCNVLGYQDTLYVHSQRHFFREVDVYGTVDFIFGNAAVVLQACNLYARRPMANQKNTITAQNRKDPNQNTGISIHKCKVVAATDLEPVKSSVSTYLGRPWKAYSRTVFMLCYMGDIINPSGWLEWNGKFALDTLYYGEYMNYGPGAAVGRRVKWSGYHVITSADEASRFTVAKFIYGSSWLPSTGVAFVSGLS